MFVGVGVVVFVMVGVIVVVTDGVGVISAVNVGVIVVVTTKERNRSIWLMAALLFLGATLYAFPGYDEELADTINFKPYYGKVVDSQTNKALPFATIEALGSNTATVTNIDGEFIIKIERKADVSQLKISYIGYQNKILDLSNFSDQDSPIVEHLKAGGSNRKKIGTC